MAASPAVSTSPVLSAHVLEETFPLVKPIFWGRLHALAPANSRLHCDIRFMSSANLHHIFTSISLVPPAVTPAIAATDPYGGHVCPKVTTARCIADSV